MGDIVLMEEEEPEGVDPGEICSIGFLVSMRHPYACRQHLKAERKTRGVITPDGIQELRGGDGTRPPEPRQARLVRPPVLLVLRCYLVVAIHCYLDATWKGLHATLLAQWTEQEGMDRVYSYLEQGPPGGKELREGKSACPGLAPVSERPSKG